MSGVISLAFDDAEAFPGHVAAQDQAKDSFAYTKSPSWWLQNHHTLLKSLVFNILPGCTMAGLTLSVQTVRA
jgi:hypothetical protein